MKKITYTSIIALFILVSWNNPYVHLKWQSKLKDPHIEVFKSTGEEGKTAFKFVADLQANQDKVLNYLFDIEQIRSKFPMCSQLEIVSQKSAYSYTFYIVLDFPIPLRDRDVYVNVNLLPLEDGNFEIITKAVENAPQSKAKYVRISTLESQTILHMKEQTAEITQYSACDLGGTIPKFLVDLVIPQKIRQSFYKMKNKLESRDQLGPAIN